MKLEKVLQQPLVVRENLLFLFSDRSSPHFIQVRGKLHPLDLMGDVEEVVRDYTEKRFKEEAKDFPKDDALFFRNRMYCLTPTTSNVNIDERVNIDFNYFIADLLEQDTTLRDIVDRQFEAKKVETRKEPKKEGEVTITVEREEKQNIVYPPTPAKEVISTSDITNYQEIDGYNLIIADETIPMPFMLTQDVINTAKSLTSNCSTDREKAIRIFQWFDGNIKFGAQKRNGIGYRHSLEVLKNREGVCGEMTYLYVAMARIAGLESKFTFVYAGPAGTNENHACAAVKLDNKMVLVDPAYHTFDIHHKGYKIVDDLQALNMFNGYRKYKRK